MKFVGKIGCCCLCGLLLVTGCSTKQYEAKKTTEQSEEVFQIGNLELEVKGKISERRSNRQILKDIIITIKKRKVTIIICYMGH